MTKPDLLLLSPLRPLVQPALAPHFTVHRGFDASTRDQLIQQHGASIRAVLAFGSGIDSGLIRRLPKLALISTSTVGYDGIDVATAAERGVVVTNTPDVLTEEVADLALGLLLSTLRDLPRAERYLREGRWSSGPFPLTTSLRGRKVGIVGLGRIGSAIARRLEGFDVPIVYHGRRQQEEVRYRYVSSLVEMAAAVDTLIVVTPGGADTRNLVDAAVLQALGPRGVLINVARGSVVDEPALIQALQNGTILAAGLDVFATEPDVPQALIDLPNTVLLPHVASASVPTRDAMAQLAVDNLIAWATGQPLLTPVPETPFAPRPV